MSAKAIIQGLEDSQLIRIFLDFIQSHRLQYQKIHKEISYKCYEATWMLTMTKATGYGRTQTEAYKNALKNLLELLMEDPSYIEYFSAILSRFMAAKNKPKDASPPVKVQLKTQGHEPEQKQKGQYESFSKVHYIYKPKQQVHHSKINLNRSMNQKTDSELQEAKNKMKALENKLNAVLQQNKVLKQRLFNDENRTSFKKETPLLEIKLNEQHEKNIINLNHQKFHQKSEKKLIKPLEKSLGSKISIPKLNLQVLPNYHKKSEKCLNDVLLAAYNQKHRPGDKINV